MRKVLVLLLAIVAVGAAGVWALGEYGGNFMGTKVEIREPVVREPELIAANGAVAPPTANSTPALRSATVPPEQTVAPQSAPAPEAATSAESPAAAAPPPANPLRPNTFDAPASGTRSAAEPPPAAPPSAAPAPPAPASDPVLQPQSAPAAAPAVAAAASAAPSVADEVKKRTLTYNRPPAKLALNRAISVSLVINATNNPEAAKDALEGFPGTPTEATVEASDTVKAQLTAAGGLQIQSETVEIQRLSSKQINRWQWRVTPTEVGNHTLTLEVLGFAAGSNAGEPLDSFKDEIQVEVQQIDQVINWAKGVQPVFAVLAALAGVMSALFAFLRFREEKKRGAGS